MLTIHYIPQDSEPFSALVEDLLRGSSRVGELHTAHAHGYTTITYQGPEGYWNPMDDCDNGDSGVWVLARIETPDSFFEGETLDFLQVEAESAGNPFGSYAVSVAQAKNMKFWLLQVKGEHYLAIDDRMFNTRDRRIIAFISTGQSAVSTASAAVVKPVIPAEKQARSVSALELSIPSVVEQQPQIVTCAATDYLYCRMCGRKIPGDSRFCMYCGIEVRRI